MLVKPEQMPLFCYWWLIQRQAAFAQNPLLYACASSSTIYFSIIFNSNKFIYFKKVKAISFINCQNVKSAFIKSKLSNRKTTANKIQLKIKSPKSYSNEFYKLSS